MIGATEAREKGQLLPLARGFLRDFTTVGGWKSARALLYVILGAILEGVSISLLVPLLGLIFDSSATPGWLGWAVNNLFATLMLTAPLSQLALLLGIFGALMIGRAIAISARDVTIYELQVGFVETQRLRIVKNLATAKWSYIARLRHSRITHLMSGDVQRLGVGIQAFLVAITASAMLVAQCVVAFLLAPFLAACFLLLLIAGTIALRPILSRAHSLGGHVADANLALLNDTGQFLASLKFVISQNLETKFVGDIREILRRLANGQITHQKQYIYGQATLTSLSGFLIAAVVLAGFGWFHVTPSVLMTLLFVVTRMIAPAGQIQQGVLQFAHVLAIYKEVRDLEHELADAARESSKRTAEAPFPQGPITFENASFRHANGSDNLPGPRNAGLRDLNIAIQQGEILGVTGNSGTGKTTFADMLVGLYPPQTGQIAVGGMRLDGATLATWRNALSYISQDPFLFHDTVRRNFSWANMEAVEGEMWHALAVAGAEDTVRGMESGLDTVVGERGALVSGGERQRIALARALLRRPKLLVLDEATSAIDSDSEKDIFLRLRALKPRPTIVLIAHRAENLAVCDRILHFDGSGHVSVEA